MLCLTVKEDTHVKLFTSDGEIVLIARPDGNTVRLKVKSPDSVVIMRSDAKQKVKR